MFEPLAGRRGGPEARGIRGGPLAGACRSVTQWKRLERYVRSPRRRVPMQSRRYGEASKMLAQSVPRNNDVIYFASRDKNLTKSERKKKEGSNQNPTSAYDIRGLRFIMICLFVLVNSNESLNGINKGLKWLQMY